ncbi:hypothetical protein AUC71_11110 [Methyloceanibacter marginalis]|uniref:Uncharacterized protein n=1 Tax=Methyloceanibacter marginalis TaxID=1774971 RepID=A0A1E3WBI2_9HYPH|nr:hypothetical protein AUC71_11110 [Methyloceanibacter marginalis]
MKAPSLAKLTRHGRHHILESSHHNLEPAGNLVVGGFEAANAEPLGFEIVHQLVPLLDQKSNLLFEKRDGGFPIILGEDLLEMPLKLIKRGIKPLKSISLVHRARPPRSTPSTHRQGA